MCWYFLNNSVWSCLRYIYILFNMQSGYINVISMHLPPGNPNMAVVFLPFNLLRWFSHRTKHHVSSVISQLPLMTPELAIWESQYWCLNPMKIPWKFRDDAGYEKLDPGKEVAKAAGGVACCRSIQVDGFKILEPFWYIFYKKLGLHSQVVAKISARVYWSRRDTPSGSIPRLPNCVW